MQWSLSSQYGSCSPSVPNGNPPRTPCYGSPFSCSSWLRWFVLPLHDALILPNSCLRSAQHIGINYTRIIKAFIIYRNAPGGPAAFFNQLSEFTQIFGSTVYVAQTLIGDSVVVRPCFNASQRPTWRADGSSSCIDVT